MYNKDEKKSDLPLVVYTVYSYGMISVGCGSKRVLKGNYVMNVFCLQQGTAEWKGLEINWQAINSRIGKLDALEGNTKYARQKSRLQVQFEEPLGSLTLLEP